MSKSILVIGTPECCAYCPVGRIFGMEGKVECRGRSGISVNNDGRTIPDWCPLRNLPKKKDLEDIAKHCGYSWQYANSEGFNACIDEILERENENEQET